ncbi:hypothetical protein [Pseudomonas granadensis]|uniref:hypothetical protein n=1 Tax=Pseudomonas granadensis TaxID=1421430 RepID=UPI00087C6218|nr:hypothetical protein [Pseudomonas granadensis]SDT31641.1 hypothetical protein SAMN05216579_3239 [Pseudomonas granadensis]
MVARLLFIATVVSVLSACSGTGDLTTASCFSSGCQSPQSATANTLKFGGNSIGSSLNQYSSGMLHDD